MTKRLYQIYLTSLTLTLTIAVMTTSAFAVEDMWTVANRIIVDVYTKIVSISTVLAGLMSAVAVIGAKLSNNQQKDVSVNQIAVPALGVAVPFVLAGGEPLAAPLPDRQVVFFLHIIASFWQANNITESRK